MLNKLYGGLAGQRAHISPSLSVRLSSGVEAKYRDSDIQILINKTFLLFSHHELLMSLIKSYYLSFLSIAFGVAGQINA